MSNAVANCLDLCLSLNSLLKIETSKGELFRQYIFRCEMTQTNFKNHTLQDMSLAFVHRCKSCRRRAIVQFRFFQMFVYVPLTCVFLALERFFVSRQKIRGIGNSATVCCGAAVRACINYSLSVMLTICAF